MSIAVIDFGVNNLKLKVQLYKVVKILSQSLRENLILVYVQWYNRGWVTINQNSLVTYICCDATIVSVIKKVLIIGTEE